MCVQYVLVKQEDFLFCFMDTRWGWNVLHFGLLLWTLKYNRCFLVIQESKK